MKVAIYARVSSDKQDVDLSISAQLRAMRDYAAKHEYQVVREFVDEAESGRTAARPAFTKMIALSKTKHPSFEGILVWKLNRFSRRRVDSITIKTLLRDRGIKVISINEPLDDSPSGQLLEGIIESPDEFYSANLGQDIKRGMRENASRGFFNGSRPPYGLHKIAVKDGVKTRHTLEPDPEGSIAVQVVRRMFDMALHGTGCKEIAKAVNADGFRTSNGRRWGKTTIHKVLTNEVYCGTLVWGGRPGHPSVRSSDPPVRVENAWSSIVDIKIFRQVQERMASKAPRVTHPRTVPSYYLLSGLLFCSCGRAMTGCSAKSHQYHYYMCSRSSKQGKDACNARSLPKEKLEQLVIGQVREKVLNQDYLEQLVKLVNEELNSAHHGLRDRLDTIDAESKDVDNRLSKLYDVLETEKFTPDDLAPRIKKLRARQDELSKAKVQVEADIVAQGAEQVDVEMVKSYAEDLRNLLAEAGFTESKTFLRSFIKRIEVNEKQVILRYNLPVPSDGKRNKRTEVLPIDTLGGPFGTVPELLFEKKQLIPSLQHLLISYREPPIIAAKKIDSLANLNLVIDGSALELDSD